MISYPQPLSTGMYNYCDTPKITPNTCISFTDSVRSMHAGEPLPRLARGRCLVLLAVLCIAAAIPTAQAKDNTQIELYKIYTHMKIGNDKQYRCVVILWRLESHWNYKARNKHSSARGIPQLLKMTEANPYKQIDLGLKYIERRYKGDGCKALAYHKKHGHY
jgi:hypothetical protein